MAVKVNNSSNKYFVNNIGNGSTSGSAASGKTNSSGKTGTSSKTTAGTTTASKSSQTSGSSTTKKTTNTASSQKSSGSKTVVNIEKNASTSKTATGGSAGTTTVSSTVSNKTTVSAAQKAAEEAARKAAAEEAKKKEQERLAWESQQKAIAERNRQEAAQKAAAEEAKRKAAEEAARKAAAEEAKKKEQERLAWESQKKAEAERNRQEAAQKAAAEEAKRKAEAEAAAKAAEEERKKKEQERLAWESQKKAEAERNRQEAAQKAAAEAAAQKAAEEAARKAAAEEAKKKEQERLAWESQQKAIAERNRQEAEKKAASAIEAYNKYMPDEEGNKGTAGNSEAYHNEDNTIIMTKVSNPETPTPCPAPSQEQNLAQEDKKTEEGFFKEWWDKYQFHNNNVNETYLKVQAEQATALRESIIEAGEKIDKYQEDVNNINLQVQLENAERANKALEATWDSYMTSLERENEQTLASAQGALQWKQIIVDNDVSDIAPEVREGLHMALDAMSVLPGGGVFDWMNAELYEAERNKVMADVSRVMITVPGALPVAKHALDKAMDLYNISKGAELMKLALNAGSLDELIEGMIQHGDEIGEVGEALAKQLSEEATEKATKEATKNVADDVVGGMVEGGLDTNLLDDMGKFTDDALENNYQAYVNRKISKGQTPKDRLEWKKASDYWTKESPVARGNNFNKTVREADIYDYHEVYLENGKRLDSYDPDAGEIISRKATDLDKITEETYRGYLSEFSQKYSEGTKIRSNAYPELDGQELKGQYILEIPASNADISNIDYYKQIAAEYDVILRFTEEVQ